MEYKYVVVGSGMKWNIPDAVVFSVPVLKPRITGNHIVAWKPGGNFTLDIIQTARFWNFNKYFRDWCQYQYLFGWPEC